MVFMLFFFAADLILRSLFFYKPPQLESPQITMAFVQQIYQVIEDNRQLANIIFGHIHTNIEAAVEWDYDTADFNQSHTYFGILHPFLNLVEMMNTHKDLPMYQDLPTHSIDDVKTTLMFIGAGQTKPLVLDFTNEDGAAMVIADLYPRLIYYYNVTSRTVHGLRGNERHQRFFQITSAAFKHIQKTIKFLGLE